MKSSTSLKYSCKSVWFCLFVVARFLFGWLFFLKKTILGNKSGLWGFLLFLVISFWAVPLLRCHKDAVGTDTWNHYTKEWRAGARGTRRNRELWESGRAMGQIQRTLERMHLLVAICSVFLGRCPAWCSVVVPKACLWWGTKLPRGAKFAELLWKKRCDNLRTFQDRF